MATGDSYDVAIVGGVVVFGEMTAESSKNVMAITGVKSKDGTYTLENEVGENDKYLKVKAYFADGTSSEIKISKINGTKLNNLTVAAGSTLEVLLLRPSQLQTCTPTPSCLTVCTTLSCCLLPTRLVTT